MTDLANEVRGYLEWMAVHNYADSTIANRRRHLGYFVCFAVRISVQDTRHVAVELLLVY